MVLLFSLITLFDSNPDAMFGPETFALFQEVETIAPRQGNERGAGVADMARAIVEGRKARVSADLCRHVTEAMNAFDVCVETGMPYRMTTTFEKPLTMTW